MSPPTTFLYEDCDVPAGQTLTAWRAERERERRPAPRRGPLARLTRRGR